MAQPMQTMYGELCESQQRMEKHASILGLLGLGAAMHVAPNLGMKALKSTQFGREALTGSLSAGVEMGRRGEKLHPNWKNLMQYGIGPESTVEMELGRHFGQRMNKMDPEQQIRFHNKVKGMLEQHVNSMSPEAKKEIHKTPLLNSAIDYFSGTSNQRVKSFLLNRTVPEAHIQTPEQHAVDAGLLLGVGTVNPHILMQPALSMVRKKMGASAYGKKVLTNLFEKGKSGAPISRTREVLTDTLLSPSALDPYRIGKALHTHVGPEKINLLDKPINSFRDWTSDRVTEQMKG
jgi:hypothetical protein